MRNFSIYIILFGTVTLAHSCKLSKLDQASESSTIEVEIAEELSAELDTIVLDTIQTEKFELDETTFLTYERTYCFGMCPVFKSTISSSGNVTYEGINFVDNIGMSSATLTADQLDSIKHEIESIQYFSLDSVYNNEMISDLPSVITSAQLEGQYNKILDRWKSPKELRDFYKLIDFIYAQLEWEPINQTE